MCRKITHFLNVQLNGFSQAEQTHAISIYAEKENTVSASSAFLLSLPFQTLQCITALEQPPTRPLPV